MNIVEQLKPHTLFFDGACERQNDEMGMGVVIKDYDRNVVFTHSSSKEAIKISDKKWNIPFSNNVAEYDALRIGLEWCIKNKINKLIIKGDSMLVINQMSNTWSVVGGQYKKLALECKRLKEDFILFQAKWIPRERNGHADKLSKQNLKSHAKKSN